MFTFFMCPGQYLKKLLSNGDWFPFVTYPPPVIGNTAVIRFEFEHFFHPEPELSRTDTGIFWIVQDGADLLRPPGTDQSFILLLDRKFIDIAFH